MTSPRLLDKIGEAMAVDYDFSEEVRGLQVPTLFACADADMFPPSHAVEVFELLDGGQRDGGWMGEGRPAEGGHALAILPGADPLQHLPVAAPGGGSARLHRRAEALTAANGPKPGATAPGTRPRNVATASGSRR